LIKIKRCKICNKLLFFKYEIYDGNFYCVKCVDVVRKIDIKKENERLEQYNKKREKEKLLQIQRAKIKNDIANNKLIEDLKKQKRKEQEEHRKKAEKLRLKLLKKEKKDEVIHDIIKKQTYKIYFDKDTIKSYDLLLYIEADVKRLLVIEWLHGKKRVVLNNEREIRRTRAGGFSAEKFQKFIDFKKNKAIDWIIELLNKPGILKLKYDKIKIASNKDYLKEELELFLKKYKR